VLAGGATPAEVREHDWADRVLEAPLQAELIVSAVCHHAGQPSRRRLVSGTRLRRTVEATLRKRGETG